jgi:hypothetical protein
MPAGLQTWNDNGLALDLTTRLPKVLGRVYFPSFSITGSGGIPSGLNGSLTDTRLGQGQLFYFFTPSGNAKAFYDGWAALGPEVMLSGTRLSWQWDADTVRAWNGATVGYGEQAGDSYLNYGIF